MSNFTSNNSEIVHNLPAAAAEKYDNDETALVIVLSILALGLAPITVASNVLVIVPFCRFSRVRTASNQILLALAITDCFLGLVLFAASLSGLSKATKVLEPEAHVNISYFLAMSMSTMQTVSLLLMVANAGDKALSLARPLHYSEIVTFTSVNTFIGVSCLIATIIGILLPLTVFHIFTDHIKDEALLLVPLGPSPERSMQISLLVFFTLPCGLTVSFCHMYVYSVASRHAKAIKREGSVRDRMASASYKLTTTSEANILDPQKLAANHLAIPRMSSLQLPATNGTVIVKDEVILKAGGRQCSSASAHHSRYGTSLALIVVMVFVTRIPSQLSSIVDSKVSDHPWPLSRKNLVFVALNAPLLLCSAINPWMFAYHNLDLKPVMQRLLKRLCRGLSRTKDAENGLNTTRNDRSLMTQWQVSQFVSAQPRRSRSFCMIPAMTPPSTIQAWPPGSGTPTSKKKCGFSRRHSQKRRSFCATMKPMKTTRSKSCTHRTIPTVTVWDGDSIRMTKPEDVVV